MADEPTNDERPEFTLEVLDRIVAQRLAEDRAKLAADVKAAAADAVQVALAAAPEGPRRKRTTSSRKTAGRQAPPMDSPPADAAGVSKTATGATGADTSKESQ